MLKKENFDHRHIILLGAGFLFLSYLSILLFDFLNVFGVRELYSGQNVPFLFDILFRERSPVEMFQWAFLGGFVLTSGILYGRLTEKERRKEGMFWLLFGILGTLMLIEDAGNIRHLFLRDYMTLEWIPLNLLETLYFGTMAVLPIYAVVRYGKYVNKEKIASLLVFLGFVFYGFAVFVSGPATLTDINRFIGDGFYRASVSLGGEELRELYEETDRLLEEQSDHHGFMDIRARFVDSLLEESLELLGATMLFGSSLSYKKFVNR